MLQNVNTVLGIYIGHDIISWSLLNRNCEVLQWSYKSFPRKEQKENILSLLQTVNIKTLKSFYYLLYKINLLFIELNTTDILSQLFF